MAVLQIPGIEDRDFSGLKQIFYGASPISEAVLRRAMDVFGVGRADQVVIRRRGVAGAPPEAAAAIKAAWDRGDREAAIRAVPDGALDTTAVVGTEAQCRERIAAYRASGMDLPIISARTNDAADFERAMRACAPG